MSLVIRVYDPKKSAGARLNKGGNNNQEDDVILVYASRDSSLLEENMIVNQLKKLRN